MEKARSLRSQILGIGTDIESLNKINIWLQKFSWSELQLVFSPREWSRSLERKEMQALDLAICFSAKEAVVKALGNTFINVSISDMEIIIHSNQQFSMALKHGENNFSVNGAHLHCSGSWAFWRGHVLTFAMIISSTHTYD